MASEIKAIYTGTKLDDESLSEWNGQWKRLTEQDQQDLRDAAAAQMAKADA